MHSAQILLSHSQGVPVAAIDGEIDLANAGQVCAQLLSVPSNASLGMIVDLSATTHLDSQGVRILFELWEKLQMRQQSIAIVLPESSPVRQILMLGSLDIVVPICRSLEEATRVVRREQ